MAISNPIILSISFDLHWHTRKAKQLLPLTYSLFSQLEYFVHPLDCKFYSFARTLHSFSFNIWTTLYYRSTLNVVSSMHLIHKRTRRFVVVAAILSTKPLFIDRRSTWTRELAALYVCCVYSTTTSSSAFSTLAHTRTLSRDNLALITINQPVDLSRKFLENQQHIRSNTHTQIQSELVNHSTRSRIRYWFQWCRWWWWWWW